MTALGGITSGAFAIGATSLQNKRARELAREQMDFQERMSNTAYQRSMKDMRKAGLNPILASKIGGASTPPGAMAPVQDIGKGASGSAAAIAKAIQELKNMRANEALTVAQVATETAKQDQLGTLSAKQVAETGKTGSETTILNAQIPRAQAEEQVKGTFYQEGLRMWEKVSPYLKSLLNNPGTQKNPWQLGPGMGPVKGHNENNTPNWPKGIPSPKLAPAVHMKGKWK